MTKGHSPSHPLVQYGQTHCSRRVTAKLGLFGEKPFLMIGFASFLKGAKMRLMTMHRQTHGAAQMEDLLAGIHVVKDLFGGKSLPLIMFVSLLRRTRK
uniref:Uncharacterized protein n=1 Tax=Solibacter usitatus (strain Ellin6076) TaxID=234267 RepID=Q01TR8_SOLUE